MGRLIDADALIADTIEHYCQNCVRRKGTKNGKVKFVYEIGDAPCRACGTGDMLDTLEDAPTVEPKRANWILTGPRLNREYECSNCKFISKGPWNYCAMCGAEIQDILNDRGEKFETD